MPDEIVRHFGTKQRRIYVCSEYVSNQAERGREREGDLLTIDDEQRCRVESSVELLRVAKRAIKLKAVVDLDRVAWQQAIGSVARACFTTSQSINQQQPPQQRILMINKQTRTNLTLRRCRRVAERFDGELQMKREARRIDLRHAAA
jgi:hypothetical protein